MKTSMALIIVAFLLAGCAETGTQQTPQNSEETTPEPGQSEQDMETQNNPESSDSTSEPESDPDLQKTGAGEEGETTDEKPEQAPNEDQNESPPELHEEENFGRTKCSRAFAPQFSAEPYYDGPLFDAHFHMPVTFEMHGMDDPVLGKDVELEEILCTFDEEKVSGSIAFFIANDGDIEGSLEKAREIEQKSGGTVQLFIMPSNLDVETLREISETSPGLFEGYGEIAFYTQYLSGSTPDDARYSEIYGIAADNSLVVMMHPGDNQKRNVENALQQNPNVKFLLHGYEIEDDVASLMDKYPNVYFSLDSATLYAMQGLFMTGPKSQFISMFRQTFDSLLNDNVNKWKKVIEKHPDRFMWGTDRGVKWHYDEEISLLMEEFARAFIARLNPDVQEKYAYKNAQEILQQ